MPAIVKLISHSVGGVRLSGQPRYIGPFPSEHAAKSYADEHRNRQHTSAEVIVLLDPSTAG